jgi:hypothetical protein
MRLLTWSLLLSLAVLHHDVWFWHTWEPLVLGFLPVGLAWHVGISLAAAAGWAMAVRYCWPAHLEGPDAPEANDGEGRRR